MFGQCWDPDLGFRILPVDEYFHLLYDFSCLFFGGGRARAGLLGFRLLVVLRALGLHGSLGFRFYRFRAEGLGAKKNHDAAKGLEVCESATKYQKSHPHGIKKTPRNLHWGL